MQVKCSRVDVQASHLSLAAAAWACPFTAEVLAFYTAGKWWGEQTPRWTGQICMAYITFASSPQAQMLRKCSTSPTKVDPAPIEASRLLAPQYKLFQSKLYSPMAAAQRGLHWDGGRGGCAAK